MNRYIVTKKHSSTWAIQRQSYEGFFYPFGTTDSFVDATTIAGALNKAAEPSENSEGNSLAVKLLSAIVHFEEYVDGGNDVDLQVAQAVLQDAEVIEARERYNELALLPVKR